MSTTALIIRNDMAVGFTAEAERLKENALKTAALIGRVSNAAENAKAAEAQTALADLRRAVEKARVDSKAPFLNAGKQIDDQAKAFIEEVAEEEKRIMKISGDFHQLQEANRKAEERRIRLEQEAIERRAREEQQRILRAEQERLAEIRREEEKLAREKAEREAAATMEFDEAARKVREAANAEARKRAEKEAAALREKQAVQDAKDREDANRRQIELQRQTELATAKTHEELDKAQERASEAQAAVVSATPMPIRAAGQRVKADIEVTIIDIYLLAKVHPGLVKMEARMTDIKAAIQAGAKIAGVTSREISVVQTTSRRLPAAIEA